jgi:hypothetical protein
MVGLGDSFLDRFFAFGQVLKTVTEQFVFIDAKMSLMHT